MISSLRLCVQHFCQIQYYITYYINEPTYIVRNQTHRRLRKGFRIKQFHRCKIDLKVRFGCYKPQLSNIVWKKNKIQFHHSRPENSHG